MIGASRKAAYSLRQISPRNNFHCTRWIEGPLRNFAILRENSKLFRHYHLYWSSDTTIWKEDLPKVNFQFKIL